MTRAAATQRGTSCSPSGQQDCLSSRWLRHHGVVLLALLGKAHWFLELVAAGSPIFVMLAWLGNRWSRAA
jgi:hypothetical protein